MYSLNSQPAPILIVPKRRSPCARLAAFLLMLVTCTLLISMCVTVGVFMTASEVSIGKFVNSVQQKASDDRVKGVAFSEAGAEPVILETEQVIQPTLTDVANVNETGETAYSSEKASEMTFLQKQRRILPTVVRVTMNIVTIGILLLSLMTLFRVYYLNGAMAEMVGTKDAFYGLCSEASEGLRMFWGHIVSLDWSACLNDILRFVKLVLVEFRNFFFTRKFTVFYSFDDTI